MEPRTRLDAGTWGTMEVGLGYCIAAAVSSPNRLVVAVEGDSGFGFSGVEVETLVRYQLPAVVIVLIMVYMEVIGGVPKKLQGLTKMIVHPLLLFQVLLIMF